MCVVSHPTPGGLGRCLVDVYITNFELIDTKVFVLYGKLLLVIQY